MANKVQGIICCGGKKVYYLAIALFFLLAGWIYAEGEKSTVEINQNLSPEEIFEKARQETLISRCNRQIKQILLAIKMYTQDYEGRYPNKLSDLYPNYLIKLDWLICPPNENKITHNEEIDTKSSYEYRGAGLTEEIVKKEPQRIVLIEKNASHIIDGKPTRYIAYADGHIECGRQQKDIEAYREVFKGRYKGLGSVEKILDELTYTYKSQNRWEEAWSGFVDIIGDEEEKYFKLTLEQNQSNKREIRSLYLKLSRAWDYVSKIYTGRMLLKVKADPKKQIEALSRKLNVAKRWIELIPSDGKLDVFWPGFSICDLAETEIRLARIYWELDDKKSSQRHLIESEKIIDEITSKLSIFENDNCAYSVACRQRDIAETWSHLGEKEKAEESYKKALELCQYVIDNYPNTESSHLASREKDRINRLSKIPVYSKKKVESKIISGEIALVDLKKALIGIRQPKNPTTKSYKVMFVSVKPETQILKDGIALELSELKIGDKVRVESTINASGQKTESIFVISKNE